MTAPRRLVALIVVCAAASARADTIEFEGGGRIEGTIVAEDASSVTIESSIGRQTIRRDRITKIERGPTSREELAQREAALQPGTADQWFELAEFARAHGMKKDRERLLDKALAIDPSHEPSNLAKGRVKHEGRWMTPAERDQLLKSAEEAAMRAKGLVQFGDRWVTPDEKAHLEQGLVRVGNKWMTEDEAKVAQGLAKVGDRWLPAEEAEAIGRAEGFAKETGLDLSIVSADHVVAATAFGRDYTYKVLDASEKAFLVSAEALGENKDLLWVGRQKLLAVVLPTREDFARFCVYFAQHEKKVDQRWADGVSKADGFFWWDPTGTSATFRGARKLEAATAHTVHHLGHVLLNRHGFNSKFLPTWIDEGYAALLEKQVLARNEISCISAYRYGRGKVRKEDLMPSANWFEAAVAKILAGQDPPFPPILRKDLTTIEPDEVSKTMVVLDYLERERHDDFLKMIKALRAAWPRGVVGPMSPEALAANAKAFDALGLPPPLLDQEVHAACQRAKAAAGAGAGGR